MKALMPFLLVALSFSLVACKDSSSGTAAANKFTENLSAQESANLDKEISAMFKHSVFTLEVTEKNGCKITIKDQVSILQEKGQSISYRNPISSTLSKECEVDSINSERAVEVTDEDTCVKQYEKNGNIVRMKSCSDDIVTIDLNTKTATGKVSGDSIGTMTVKAITVDKALLTKELENITIVYMGSDGNGEQIEKSREIGNALEILDITL